jgi:muramoyltetrapeptide carboxypeptidase LdcA involved in peptidoglycan recycling
MRPDLTPPPKLSPGDRVAVLSLSFAAPAVFPAVHEQAMRRLRAEFGLEPVEYPTTRRLNADPRDRAADLMAAFADPGIAGLLATIGGDDLLTVLPFLDPELVVANPKPFAGYSDNTNLLNWLWNLGLASWHGGSTMVHLGRGGGLNPVSAGSLRAALLDGRSGPEAGHHVQRRRAGLGRPVRADVVPGAAARCGLGLAPGRRRDHRPDLGRQPGDPALEPGRVPLDPSPRGLRRLLAQFPAVIVGRPKAATFGIPADLTQRQRYRDDQRDAVLRALTAYHPTAMAVFNVDFGHTDPQYVLPYGGLLTVDGPARRITAHY